MKNRMCIFVLLMFSAVLLTAQVIPYPVDSRGSELLLQRLSRSRLPGNLGHILWTILSNPGKDC